MRVCACVRAYGVCDTFFATVCNTCHRGSFAASDSSRFLSVNNQARRIEPVQQPSGCVLGQPLEQAPIVKVVDLFGDPVANVQGYLLLVSDADSQLYPSYLPAEDDAQIVLPFLMSMPIFGGIKPDTTATYIETVVTGADGILDFTQANITFKPGHPGHVRCTYWCVVPCQHVVTRLRLAPHVHSTPWPCLALDSSARRSTRSRVRTRLLSWTRPISCARRPRYCAPPTTPTCAPAMALASAGKAHSDVPLPPSAPHV